MANLNVLKTIKEWENEIPHWYHLNMDGAKAILEKNDSYTYGVMLDAFVVGYAQGVKATERGNNRRKRTAGGKMLRAYKTEIAPTEEQKGKINRTIGVCRYVYNLYLARNKEVYESGGKFISAFDFNKWLNNVYMKENPDKGWIKEVSSKSVTQSVRSGEAAFKRFFKGLGGYPKFKKKNRSDVKMFFVRNRASDVIGCTSNAIKIPTLGWVRIKEKDYIPTNPRTHVIRSGTIQCYAGRYYVSVLVEEADKVKPTLNEWGIGIDVGIKELAVCSDGRVFENINKYPSVKKLEKSLKRQQRRLSRRYEALKAERKKGKGEANETHKNIDKQILKVQRIHQRLYNIRTDYINKCVNEVVKSKPQYVTLEDLNVRGMMKNRHLSRAIAQQKLNEFMSKLETKCRENGIEVRLVDRWYPSSRICHECGSVKKDLKLSDRVYICECGYKADRDYNASLNLRDATAYRLA